MTRRALLIGSETYGLAGCNADVTLMRDVLKARGFDPIDARTDQFATRAGIVAGLESLISAVGPGDAVVVYYSGHGGRVTRPDFEERKAAGASVYFQFIVPFDMGDSAPGNFRGLMSEELTRYQKRLTDAFHGFGETPNVTTILDCCHSGYMARDATARRKSIALEPKSFSTLGIFDHVRQFATEADGLATNPDVVRIVACEPEQSAFEFESSRGGPHGALTDALATVLDGLGPTPQSWAIISDLVRRRVSGVVPEQRPEVEGPAERLMFSPDSMPARTALPLTSIDGVLAIEAADILGIAAGDQFRLLSTGNDDSTVSDDALGTAVVASVENGNGLLTVSLDASKSVGPASVATTAVAVPTRISVPRALVFVDAETMRSGGDDGVRAEGIREAITGSLRIAVGEDRGAAMAVVVGDPGGLAILDPIGAKWRTDDFADDAAGHQELIASLEQIAIGQRLRNLASGSGANAMDPVVSIDFGVVEAGGKRPLALHGERLTVGERVYLTMTNTTQDPVFVWVYDIGVSGRANALSNAAMSGTMLGCVGAEDDTASVWDAAGQILRWPPDVPTDPARAVHADADTVTAAVGGSGDVGERARPESFVVITADRRCNLGPLVPPIGRTRGGSQQSALDAILNEARSGMRDVEAVGAGETPLRYRLDHIDFLLLPS